MFLKRNLNIELKYKNIDFEKSVIEVTKNV